MSSKVSEYMSTVVVSVGLNSSMDEVISVLARSDNGRVLVMENERPLSMITTRSVIAAFAEYGTEIFKLKAKDLMSEDLVSILPELSVMEAIRVLINNNIGGVPVIEGNVVRGMFTERDVIKIIASLQFSGIVDSIMNTKVETIPQSSSILDAAKVMSFKNIRRLPIVNEYKMIGIITAADIVKYLDKFRRIGNVMEAGTQNPWTISRYTRIVDAAKIMKEKRIGTLPVVDKNRLIGIVTERDLMYSLLTVEFYS